MHKSATAGAAEGTGVVDGVSSVPGPQAMSMASSPVKITSRNDLFAVSGLQKFETDRNTHPCAAVELTGRSPCVPTST